MPTHTSNDSDEYSDCRPSTDACGADTEDEAESGARVAGGSRADAALLAEQVIAVLDAHRINRPDAAKVTSFVRELDARKQAKKVWLRYLARNSGWGTMDILGFIHEAQQAGDHDEALWRAFVAAHFGRTSADERAMDSAGALLVWL